MSDSAGDRRSNLDLYGALITTLIGGTLIVIAIRLLIWLME